MDIEQKIDTIKQSIKPGLQTLHAIDESGHVVNRNVFEHFIKQKISELQKIEHLVVDRDGNTVDRYGANLWMKAVSELQEIMKCNSLDPQSDKLAKIRDLSDKKAQKQSLFHRVITNTFNPHKR